MKLPVDIDIESKNISYHLILGGIPQPLTGNSHQKCIKTRDGLVGPVSLYQELLVKYCDEILKLPLHLPTHIMEELKY